MNDSEQIQTMCRWIAL